MSAQLLPLIYPLLKLLQWIVKSYIRKPTRHVVAVELVLLLLIPLPPHPVYVVSNHLLLRVPLEVNLKFNKK